MVAFGGHQCIYAHSLITGRFVPARRILRRTITHIIFKNWSSQILEQFNRGICFRGHSNSHQGTASSLSERALGISRCPLLAFSGHLCLQRTCVLSRDSGHTAALHINFTPASVTERHTMRLVRFLPSGRNRPCRGRAVDLRPACERDLAGPGRGQ